MPQFEQVSVFSSLIFWSILSFGLLLFLLKRYAFPPILEALEEREKKIRGDIEGAEKLKDEAEKMKAEFEEQLKTAHEKSNTILQMAADESRRIQEKTLHETQAKVRQMQKEAEHEIESSRHKLLGEMRKFTADLTIASTEKILKKALSEDDKKRLVDDSIQDVMRELEEKQAS